MTWRRVNLGADEFAQPTEPPVALGLLYRGLRHAISGPPESAKTLLVLIGGLEHLRGGDGLFALVDFEMGERAIRRLLEDLGATADEIASVYYVAPDGPPTDGDVDDLVTAGVTLVVIDAASGAYDASGLDDNKRADAERFAREWIRPLWLRGIATVLVDHVVKHAGRRGRYAIGSERKLGSVDVHLGCEVVTPLHRGGEAVIRVATHKDRPAHLRRPHAAQIELHSDPDTHRVTWTVREATPDSGSSSPFRPTALMERVSRYLEAQNEPASRSTVVKAVGGKATWTRTAIDHLVADGYLEETAGPRGARRVRTVSPFRATPSNPVPTQSQDHVPDPVPRPPLRERDGDDLTDGEPFEEVGRASEAEVLG